MSDKPGVAKCQDDPNIMAYPSRSRVYYLRPAPAMFHIEDIAHHLSMTCRYTGAISRFYSVAEHCCHVADEVIERAAKLIGSPGAARHIAKAALLHDASEAYMTDVPSPLKRLLPEYKAIEHNMSMAIYARFEVLDVFEHAGWAELIHTVDREIYNTESAKLHYLEGPRGENTIGCTIDDSAESRVLSYLDRAYKILNQAMPEDYENTPSESLVEVDFATVLDARQAVKHAILALETGGVHGRWRREFIQRFAEWS